VLQKVDFVKDRDTPNVKDFEVEKELLHRFHHCHLDQDIADLKASLVEKELHHKENFPKDRDTSNVANFQVEKECLRTYHYSHLDQDIANLKASLAGKQWQGRGIAPNFEIFFYDRYFNFFIIDIMYFNFLL